MELMNIIGIMVSVLGIIAVLVFSVSFLIYKSRSKQKRAAMQVPEQEYREEIPYLRKGFVYPARLDLQNVALVYKYKKEQERLNKLRRSAAHTAFNNRIPEKFTVINNLHSKYSNHQAGFRINYADQTSMIERQDSNRN